MRQEQLGSGVLPLPDLQQQIVNWLIRRPLATADQIAVQLLVDVLVVEDALTSLIELEIVTERVVAGKICYSITGADNLDLNFDELEDLPRQALTPGKPLSVIINPAGEVVALPGTTVEICVTLTNQGDRSAIFDVYIDEGSGLVYQWCAAAHERLALSSGQSSEIIFAIAIPTEALPNTYNFMVVVDAPLHYPEDTPIQHQGQITVNVPLQEVVKVNDPTFGILPKTSPAQPQPLQPGEPMQLTITVVNRSERVDRFRVTLPDLEPTWFNIYYPEGLAQAGIITASDGLQLNPNESGKISLIIKPPLDTWAGVYTPAVKIHSANYPDLTLLDVVYIEVQPVYLMQIEFVTLSNRVKKEPALYDLRFHNQGNTIREFSVKAITTEEPDLCDFSFAPAEVQLLPKAMARVSLQVQITRKCKPRFFIDRFLSFSVEITDKRQLPLFNNRFPGNLMVPARPWWQLLLLVLTILGLVGTIVFLVWYFFFRPPLQPEVLEFASEANNYNEVEGEAVKLRWRINNPDMVQTLTIVGRSPENKVISRSVSYDFSQGIPLELREFCTVEQILICQNVPTDARKAGSYIFELAVIPKGNRGVSLTPIKTSSILIAPIPIPQVLEVNPSQPSFMEVKPTEATTGANAEPTSEKPPEQVPEPTPDSNSNPKNNPIPPTGGVLLNWRISHYRQLKEVQMTARTPKGEVVSEPIRYDLSLGMPEALQDLCQVENGILICRNLPTGVASAGDYIFEITAIPKQAPADPKAPPESRKTDVVKVNPLPINLVEFTVNGQEVLPRYVFNVSAASPTVMTILWKIEGSAKMLVELLPAPGTVSPTGQATIPLPPEASETTYSLQITNPDGTKVTRSFIVQTIPIPPPHPRRSRQAPRPPHRPQHRISPDPRRHRNRADPFRSPPPPQLSHQQAFITSQPAKLVQPSVATLEMLARR